MVLYTINRLYGRLNGFDYSNTESSMKSEKRIVKISLVESI